MKIIVLAQNVPYLVSIGVPEENAQPILDFLATIEKNDRGKYVRQVKQNPKISLDELKGFKVITKEEKEKAKEEKLADIPESIKEWIKNLNPKIISDPNLFQWLAKQVINESVATNGEDDEKVKATLKRFEFLRRKPSFPKENRYINHYKTFTELWELIQSLQGEDEASEAPSGDPDIIYDKNGVKVLATSNAEKASQLATGTSWCVRHSSTGQSYLNQGGPFYFIYLNDERVALMHIPSGQIKNVADEALNNYHVIKQINPALQELNISPSGGADTKDYMAVGYDFKRYSDMLKLGSEISTKVAESKDKAATLAQIQKEKEATDNNFGSERRQQNVIFFLSDELYDDPQIQSYASPIINQMVKNMSFYDFLPFYKKLPYQIRLLPEVRENNKKFFLDAFQTENIDNEFYMQMGKELKVLPEIQKAYLEHWRKKVINDPFQYSNKDLPPRFKPLLKQDFLKGFIVGIAKGPSAPQTGDRAFRFPLYDKCPEEIKNSPEVINALNQGLLAAARDYPKHFDLLPPEKREDPEFIEANKQGWFHYINTIDVKRLVEDDINNRIPPHIKETKEYQDLKKERILSHYIGLLRKSKYLQVYQQFPEDIKKDPAITRVCEMKAIDMMKNDLLGYRSIPPEIRKLQRVSDVETKVFIPHWISELKSNRHLYPMLPDDIQKLPKIKEALKQGWINELTNLNDMEKASAVWQSAPDYVRNDPQIAAAVGPLTGNIWLETCKQNPFAFLQAPENIKRDPVFLSGFKEILLNNIKTKTSKDIKPLSFFISKLPPSLSRDTEILSALNSLKGKTATQWYDLYKFSENTGKIIPKETMEIEALEVFE